MDLANAKLNQPQKADNTVAFPQGKVNRIKLGQLLLEAGIITSDKLHEALKISQDSGHAIGKVLSALNYVCEKDLQSAFLAQSLVSEGILDERTAVKALSTASRSKTTLAEVLEQTESHQQSSDDSGELEDMLIRTRMISDITYSEAKAKSKADNIPFGRALLLINGISFAHLNSALEALDLIKKGKLVPEEAMRALKEVRRSHITFEQALSVLKISPRTTVTRIKLGDLLARSRVITERESLAAVERALIERRMLGEILVGSGLVSVDLVNDALTLQQMVIREVITLDTAVQALKRVKEQRKSLAQVAVEMNLYKDDESISSGVIAMLMKSEIITSGDVKRAKKAQADYDMDALKALLASDLISPVTFRAAVACVELVRSNKVTEGEGIVALQTADRKRCTLAEAFVELGGQSVKRPTAQSIATSVKVKAIEETKKANMSNDVKVLIFLSIAIVSGCVVAPMVTPVDWQMYAIAFVLLLGSLLMFAIGRIWRKREEKQSDQIAEQVERAKGVVCRLTERHRD